MVVTIASVAAACGGATNVTASETTRPSSNLALVFGRISQLGCPNLQSLYDQAMIGDERHVMLVGGGKTYVAGAEAGDGFFAAALPPGRYRLSSYYVATVGKSMSPKSSIEFEARANQATYVGSFRHICLNWQGTGGGTELTVIFGIVREPEQASTAFREAFPQSGTLVDGSEPLAAAAPLPLPARVMDRYAVYVRATVTEELRTLPQETAKAVANGIDLLASNPRPAGAEAVTGTTEYRLRHGTHTLEFFVDDAAKLVLVADLVQEGPSGRKR